MNEYVHIYSANYTESSEALAAEEMTFEFLQMSRWTELKSSGRREGCSMSLGPTRQSLAD